MKNIFKNNKVVGGGVLVVVALLLYYFYFSGGSAPLLTSGQETTSPLSQELLSTLGNLHTITLDPQIFSDPTFVSLTDFGVTIPPEAVGRRNPFEPIGGTSAQVSTSTSR